MQPSLEPEHARDSRQVAIRKGVIASECGGELALIQLDDLAFTLRRAHGTYLLALARKLCRRHHDPDDLVQDTYVRAIASPVPEGANERAWLSRVMHNLFIDWIRRRDARREDVLTDLPAAAPVEAEAWWLSLTREDVMRVVDQLPQDQRSAFKMFTFDGKSYDEIAAAQGIAKATVGTRILRARVRIREILEEEHASAERRRTSTASFRTRTSPMRSPTLRSAPNASGYTR